LGDDLADLVHRPALTQPRDVVAHPRHRVLVRTSQPEGQLRVRSLDHVPPLDQAVPVEGAAERQRTGLGDDGAVEVEEGGTLAHGEQSSQAWRRRWRATTEARGVMVAK